MVGRSVTSSVIGSAAVAVCLWAAATSPSYGEDLRIGGTGMALAAMRHAGDGLRAVASDVTVTVLPSLGTPGGLKALAQGAIDVAVTGRPLKADEREKGAVDAGCVTTPLLFATSHPSPQGISKAQVPSFYAEARPVWSDGKPLKVILRSRAGSENTYLAAAIPGMAAALEDAYKRPDIPVATTDQENAEQALRIAGSFAVMTLLQLRAEKLNLHALALDGVVPSAATVLDKTYPLSASVCVVLPTNPSPAAKKLVAFLKSEAGQALLASFGATPLR